MPGESGREIYFREGIRYLPHLLELVDRNRLSDTYGCFDRSFWHYRTSDFPSGMYQEAVLSLALAYLLAHPENPFYQEPRLKELVEAGIAFAQVSSHADGATDDYFPFERAAGAAAFSLYACTEAALLLKLNRPDFLEFFKKRGRYLDREGHRESGILSNHHALFALALFNVFLVTGDTFFKERAEKRLDESLALQTEEGWFPEYEGCDPGYLSFTIDFLAKYYQKSHNEKILPALRKAVMFSSYFLHPDGSYGGEYGSRNTFHFLPHGMELLAGQAPEALPMAEAFLSAALSGRRSYLEDDRIFGHYVYNFLQAYRDYAPRPEGNQIRPLEEGIKIFKEAGLVVKRTKEDYAVISTVKGGVMKIYKKGRLRFSDCGLAGRSSSGTKFISQTKSGFNYDLQEERLSVEGACAVHRDLVFTPVSFLLFRLFNLLVGRFLPANLLRQWLQKKSILKKVEVFPLRFKKVLNLKTLEAVEYVLTLEGEGLRLEELWIASDATFIYIATSQPFQPGSLMPWVDLSGVLPELHQNQTTHFRYPLL